MKNYFFFFQNFFRVRKIYSRVLYFFTINNYFKKKNTIKKSLLVYSNEYFLIGETFNQIINFRSFLIAKEMDKYGYQVDIIDYRNPLISLFLNKIKKKKYDVILYHGKNFHKLFSNLNLNSTYLVYLSTGLQPDYLNKKIKQRIDYLKKRKHLNNIEIETGFEKKTLSHLQSSDIILTAEIRRKKELERNFNKVIFTYNQFPFDNIKYIERNFDKSKKNFLFYSSGTQIAKGLDILLDVFSNKDNVNLYISSFYENEKKFKKIYKNELFNKKNIFPCGFNNVNTNNFKKLISNCLFVICPTVTEGQPGSIINCLASGMIPIVPDDCNFENINKYGFSISPNIKEINSTLEKIDKLDNKILMSMSQKSFKNTTQFYSKNNFEKNISKMIKYIIKNPKS